MKKFIGFLLIAAMIAALTACGGAPAPVDSTPQPTEASYPDSAAAQAQLSSEEQKQVLEDNREFWAFTEPYDSPWFYTFTDLDRNGRLEVIAATTQGTGIFTYANFWEVLPDGSGIDNCYHKNAEIEGPDDWPEIIQDSLPCYYDALAGCYYYPCENVTRDGYAHQYYSWQALCLEDGAADWEYLASKNVNWRDEDTGEDYPDAVTVCEDAAGNPISEQDYDSMVEKRFAGMEKSELQLTWVRVENPWPEEEPLSGDAEAAGLQDSSLFAEGPAVVITKNPTSESIAVGGKTWFIAHADNAVSLSWQLVDPEGTVYSLEQAMERHPGLSLQALEGDTLAVSNAPQSLNGWGIQAVFDGEGNLAVTTPAYIYVGDFVTAYRNVIDAYRTAYSTGNSQNGQYLWEHGLSEVAAYSTGVGYALKDLDKNGVPELIVAGMGTDDFSENMAYDIYTLVNGAPANIATSQARSRYYILADNTLLSEGSGGASHTYITLQKVNGSSLEDLEMVFTDYDEASGATVFYSQQGHSDNLPSEKSTRISENEFQTRWDQWKNRAYVPPLTAIF